MSETLITMLQSLNLSGIADIYFDEEKKAAKKHVSYYEFLETLVKAEIEQRRNDTISRLLKKAKLPRNKNIADFDFTRVPDLSPAMIKNIQTGDFIDKCENILIFGNPGTGKTHIAIALAQEWCAQARKCFFTTAANLVQQLLVAKSKVLMNNLIKRLDKFEVLVIDDISYIPYSKEESDLLFVLLAERYEQRSVVITSNLVFSNWNVIFKDEMTTAAAINRLVHHSTIIELNAESYRMKSAKNIKSNANLNERKIVMEY